MRSSIALISAGVMTPQDSSEHAAQQPIAQRQRVEGDSAEVAEEGAAQNGFSPDRITQAPPSKCILKIFSSASWMKKPWSPAGVEKTWRCPAVALPPRPTGNARAAPVTFAA